MAHASEPALPLSDRDSSSPDQTDRTAVCAPDRRGGLELTAPLPEAEYGSGPPRKPAPNRGRSRRSPPGSRAHVAQVSYTLDLDSVLRAGRVVGDCSTHDAASMTLRREMPEPDQVAARGAALWRRVRRVRRQQDSHTALESSSASSRSTSSSESASSSRRIASYSSGVPCWIASTFRASSPSVRPAA